jgi:hypothetical protein
VGLPKELNHFLARPWRNFDPYKATIEMINHEIAARMMLEMSLEESARSQDQGRVAPLSSMPPHMHSWPLESEVNPKRYRGRSSEPWGPPERRDQIKETGLNW